MIRRSGILVLLAALLILAVPFVISVTGSVQQAQQTGRVEARAFVYCSESGGDDCSAWADAVGSYPVAACADADLVASCLFSAGVPLFSRVGSNP